MIEKNMRNILKDVQTLENENFQNNVERFFQEKGKTSIKK